MHTPHTHIFCTQRKDVFLFFFKRNSFHISTTAVVRNGATRCDTVVACVHATTFSGGCCGFLTRVNGLPFCSLLSGFFKHTLKGTKIACKYRVFNVVYIYINIYTSVFVFIHWKRKKKKVVAKSCKIYIAFTNCDIYAIYRIKREDCLTSFSNEMSTRVCSFSCALLEGATFLHNQGSMFHKNCELRFYF